MKIVNDISYLTYKEAASRLDVKPNYIAVLVARDKLQAIKFPHNSGKYIQEDELEAYKQGIPFERPNAVVPSSTTPTPDDTSRSEPGNIWLKAIPLIADPFTQLGHENSTIAAELRQTLVAWFQLDSTQANEKFLQLMQTIGSQILTPEGQNEFVETGVDTLDHRFGKYTSPEARNIMKKHAANIVQEMVENQLTGASA